MTSTIATPDMLRRIDALLSKAASTDHEAEAAAFYAKAQDLMMRHAIDESMLRASKNEPLAEIVAKVVPIENPYPRAKATLFCAVAKSLGCYAVLAPARNKDKNAFYKRQMGVSIFGTKNAIENVERLFQSMLVFAITEMPRAEKSRRAHDGISAFRNAFMVGFANRLGQRLAKTREDVKSEPGVGLVLVTEEKRSRDEGDVFFKKAGVKIVQRRSSLSSSGGYKSGIESGNRANVGRHQVSGQKALNS